MGQVGRPLITEVEVQTPHSSSQTLHQQDIEPQVAPGVCVIHL